MTHLRVAASLVILLSAVAGTAVAQDIKIGITGTFTGPTAALGIPYRQAAELFPTKVGDRTVNGSFSMIAVIPAML